MRAAKKPSLLTKAFLLIEQVIMKTKPTSPFTMNIGKEKNK